MTPKEYLLRLRLEKAKQLLLYSALSIKEIASTLDFFDQYHFSRFFRTRTGYSPTAYRENGLGADFFEMRENHSVPLKKGGNRDIVPPDTPPEPGETDPCALY